MREVYSIAEARSASNLLLIQERGYWHERFTEVHKDQDATSDQRDMVKAIVYALEARLKKAQLRAQYGEA